MKSKQAREIYSVVTSYNLGLVSLLLMVLEVGRYRSHFSNCSQIPFKYQKSDLTLSLQQLVSEYRVQSTPTPTLTLHLFLSWFL